ncbi:MAG: hypothetical protein HY725_07060 [Candidatus Rokubacteria bacterium]|nr:hypothetical protein [Candidatus Rokubacteria bacterium]
MEDRQYRQRGYKDDARKTPAKRQEPSVSRPPATPGSRSVARCSDCGALLPAATDPLGQCPGCSAELHSCKQCTHFDPGHRFECTQPISERLPDKRARNACPSFSLRVTVERGTPSGATRPEDARRAFDNLFKK